MCVWRDVLMFEVREGGGVSLQAKETRALKSSASSERARYCRRERERESVRRPTGRGTRRAARSCGLKRRREGGEEMMEINLR
jgi:hypothetical protein